MDVGFNQASSSGVLNPLPIGWLGRADAPAALPAWAIVGQMSSVQVQNLLSQISYDLSGWDTTKIGPNNQLGSYQFGTTTLENYGILAAGSNLSYGTDCINYKSCWQQVMLKGTNSFSNYLFNCNSLYSFLNSSIAQEHLAYQIVYDTYTELTNNGVIVDSDTVDTVAGMIYVGWMIGSSAAYSWRRYGRGTASNYFNSGRYAVTVLSQ